MELLKKILTFFGLKIIHTKQKRLNKDIITLETYKKYFPEDSIKYRRFYNLGAGKFRHPYWTNIDKKKDSLTMIFFLWKSFPSIQIQLNYFTQAML